MDDFEVPVFKKAYDFYREFFACVENFPKHIKYTLGQRCENLIAEILADILQASQSARLEKAKYLEIASRNLNLLRVDVRLIKDFGFLEMPRYVALQSDIDEIGRQLGSWLVSLRSNL